LTSARSIEENDRRSFTMAVQCGVGTCCWDDVLSPNLRSTTTSREVNRSLQMSASEVDDWDVDADDFHEEELEQGELAIPLPRRGGGGASKNKATAGAAKTASSAKTAAKKAAGCSAQLNARKLASQLSMVLPDLELVEFSDGLQKAAQEALQELKAAAINDGLSLDEFKEVSEKSQKILRLATSTIKSAAGPKAKKQRVR
jgi:hypothetical protein